MAYFSAKSPTQRIDRLPGVASPSRAFTRCRKRTEPHCPLVFTCSCGAFWARRRARRLEKDASDLRLRSVAAQASVVTKGSRGVPGGSLFREAGRRTDELVPMALPLGKKQGSGGFR